MSKIAVVQFESPQASQETETIFRQHGTASGPEISVPCFDANGHPSRLLVQREGERSLSFHVVGE